MVSKERKTTIMLSPTWIMVLVHFGVCANSVVNMLSLCNSWGLIYEPTFNLELEYFVIMIQVWHFRLVSVCLVVLMMVMVPIQFNMLPICHNLMSSFQNFHCICTIFVYELQW